MTLFMATVQYSNGETFGPAFMWMLFGSWNFPRSEPPPDNSSPRRYPQVSMSDECSMRNFEDIWILWVLRHISRQFLVLWCHCRGAACLVCKAIWTVALLPGSGGFPAEYCTVKTWSYGVLDTECFKIVQCNIQPHLYIWWIEELNALHLKKTHAKRQNMSKLRKPQFTTQPNNNDNTTE